MAQKILKDIRQDTEPDIGDETDLTKPSKMPLYVLIFALAIVVILLGYLTIISISTESLPKIEPYIVIAVIVVIFASIAYEILMKPNIFLYRKMDRSMDEKNINSNKKKDATQQENSILGENKSE